MLRMRFRYCSDTQFTTPQRRQNQWNIKGPNFIALHEMIDGFRSELDEYVDTIAERVVQLGGSAFGTTQTVAAATTLAPYPTDIYASEHHLAALRTGA